MRAFVDLADDARVVALRMVGPQVGLAADAVAGVGRWGQAALLKTQAIGRMTGEKPGLPCADCETPSLAAAFVKLRSLATARNASRSLMSSRGTRRLQSSAAGVSRFARPFMTAGRMHP